MNLFTELMGRARDALTPSVGVALANATREIERLEAVASSARERAMRLYDRAEALEREASDVLYESTRGFRVANRFRELLD